MDTMGIIDTIIFFMNLPKATHLNWEQTAYTLSSFWQTI